MKKKFVCSNCRNSFFSEDAKTCPRCNSKKIFRQETPRVDVAVEEKNSFVYSPRVYGETKTAWKSFYSQDTNKCSSCGSTEFLTDFKHKEKTCKKCGNILSLGRRQA